MLAPFAPRSTAFLDDFLFLFLIDVLRSGRHDFNLFDDLQQALPRSIFVVQRSRRSNEVEGGREKPVGIETGPPGRRDVKPISISILPLAVRAGVAALTSTGRQLTSPFNFFELLSSFIDIQVPTNSPADFIDHGDVPSFLLRDAEAPVKDILGDTTDGLQRTNR